MKTLLTLMTFLLILSGCGASTSNYLRDKPLVIVPEQSIENQVFAGRPQRAFLAALQRYGWQIRDINSQRDFIVAEACRGTHHCVEIEARIGADGTVSIIRSPGQKLSDSEGNMLIGWMRNLQREYQKNMDQMR